MEGFCKFVDRKLPAFSQVSKKFLVVACIRLAKLQISFLDILNDILPGSPNLVSFKCTKPRSNTHIKLLAHSCPKLQYLKLYLEQNVDPNEFDFDDDGLCAAANACRYLYAVDTRKRLHVCDVGVVSLIRSSKNLASLDLGECVNVVDKSLKDIGEVGRLWYLSLQGCKRIRDFGLGYLANGDLRNYLDELILAECDKISDDGIICLKQMVGLTYLNLSKCGTNITDFGVFAISQIPNIEKLDLFWLISVTDSSVCIIVGNCWKLRVISLTGCKDVTTEGLCAFADHRTLEELEMLSCHDISWKDVELVADSCSKVNYIGLSKRIDENQHDFHMINICWIVELLSFLKVCESIAMLGSTVD